MVDFNPQDYEQNPLKKYFRQPKIHIPLPSNGKYYPEGSVDIPETGEFPIFAMTAKDELTMKTPDALLNGQATVDVIQSCVPSIKNAWDLPTLDLDALLLAIRIATYGEVMEITADIPGTKEKREFQIDIRKVLNQLVTATYESEVQMGDLKVFTRPLTYKEFTKTSLQTFEEQRVFAIINNDEIDDEEKLDKFNKSFKKLTDISVSMLNKCVWKIQIGDTEVTNEKHIQEFMENSDKEFYTFIMEHLEEQKKKFQIKPLKVSSTEEDIANGAPAEWELPITFDQANFFA